MSKFNRGGQGGRGFDRGGRGRDFEKRMFSATCAECGDRCEVPFRPTGEKPVLCNNCFRGGDDRGARREKRFDRPRREERPSRDNRLDEQFEQLNVKLDLIMKEIEKLKQPNKVHTLEADTELTKEKPAKKAKKTKEEISDEEVSEDKPVKKKSDKKENNLTTPKATKGKKTAKKAKK